MTLATGVPVMLASVSNVTTLYYTPFVGDQIPLTSDGVVMEMVNFTEISVLTTNTSKNPAAIGASKINDWFVWNDAGTLRLTHGPDWTDDYTPSAGSAVELVDGVLVNSVAITNGPAAKRGTYVGTTRSNSALGLDWVFGGSAANGTAALLHVWNAYNRVDFSTIVTATAAHTYSSGTIRQFGGATSMMISVVLGMSAEPISWVYKAELYLAAAVGAFGIMGVGFDTTTAFSWPRERSFNNPTAVGTAYSAGGNGIWKPDRGRRILMLNEQSDTTNANEFNNSLSALLAAQVTM